MQRKERDAEGGESSRGGKTRRPERGASRPNSLGSHGSQVGGAYSRRLREGVCRAVRSWEDNGRQCRQFRWKTKKLEEEALCTSPSHLVLMRAPGGGARHRDVPSLFKITQPSWDMNQAAGIQSPLSLPLHSAAPQAFCQQVEPIGSLTHGRGHGPACWPCP